MVCSPEPMQLDRPRQRIPLNRLTITHGVALPLYYQGWHPQRRKMRYPRFFRPCCCIERIPQADQSICTQLVGNQTGHAPPHGLATNGQSPAMGLPDMLKHLSPAVQKDGLSIRRPPHTSAPSHLHVRKLEAQHGYASTDQAFNQRIHERTVHWRACTVGQDKRRNRLIFRNIFKQRSRLAEWPALIRVNIQLDAFP